MGATTKSLYDTDFVEWAGHTAKLLRERRFEDVDLENLIEEVEDLGKRDRYAVRSQLSRMLMHLVKERIQPERAGRSWRASVVNARRAMRGRIAQSPSLRPYLDLTLEEVYQEAVTDALDETQTRSQRTSFHLPVRCPFTIAELLSADPDELKSRLG